VFFPKLLVLFNIEILSEISNYIGNDKVNLNESNEDTKPRNILVGGLLPRGRSFSLPVKLKRGYRKKPHADGNTEE
jgi:hypothetical protein